MKAKVFTIILAALFSVATISAKEPETKILQNIETSEFGTIKEMIIMNDIQMPSKKMVYHYGNDGLLLEKDEYKWISDKGWTGVQKYEYEYNKDNKLTYLTYTKWDDKLSAWSEYSKQFIHLYDITGKLYTVKDINIDNSKDMAITR